MHEIANRGQVKTLQGVKQTIYDRKERILKYVNKMDVNYDLTESQSNAPA